MNTLLLLQYYTPTSFISNVAPILGTTVEQKERKVNQKLRSKLNIESRNVFQTQAKM